MKSKASQKKAVLTLAIVAAFTVSSHAVVTVSFGETDAPTSNVITSYEPGSQSTLGWLRTPDQNRIVAETFITPVDSDYLMNAITMKLFFNLPESFAAPSGFTIDFYELSSPGQQPETGTFLATQSGFMQPTTSVATAGTYFTFNLDTPLALEAGVSYGYVLAFNSVETYNLLHPAISEGAADPDGSRAWLRINGGAWEMADGQTYVYYIQGTAVPEPGTVALVGLAAGCVLLVRRKVAKRL